MEIGVVGKPNVGKSTFFEACTLAGAEIKNYPFTTIEANRGVGHVRARCPHTELGNRCNPRNSLCHNGTRLVPVEVIDVAGLVPDAHSGRGLGNRFLDDLRQADVLVHVVDASGGTDAEGNPCEIGAHDPLEDVRFLEDEVAWWIEGILERNWRRLSKRAETVGEKIQVLIHEQLTGLGVSEHDVGNALRQTGLEGKPSSWRSEELLELSRAVQRISKPIVVAANKIDVAPEANLERLIQLRDQGQTVIPCFAEGELALRRAARAGLISYLPGVESFEISEPTRLNRAQRDALDRIAEVMEKWGGTGVQSCLETAVFDILQLIPVYPVEDETHFTDSEGKVLPDVYLLPEGSTVRDLAFKVHTELGERFIRAIDARTKRVVGSEHPLKEGDVIKIVAHR